MQTWVRPPWAVLTQSYPGSPGVNPFAYWPQPVPFSQDTIRTPVTCSQSNSSSVLQNSELVSSVKEVLSDFKKSMSDDLATISSRISSLEAGHRVSLPTPCEEVSDLISMAPGSQEATVLSEDEYEEGESSMARVANKVPLAGQNKSVTSTDVGSPRESEAEDSSVSSKYQLRARVYSLLREVAHVPLSSPRLKKTSSIFETCLFHNFLGPNQLMGFAFLSPCGPNRRTCSVVLHMFWVLLSSFFQQLTLCFRAKNMMI